MKAQICPKIGQIGRGFDEKTRFFVIYREFTADILLFARGRQAQEPLDTADAKRIDTPDDKPRETADGHD